MKEKTKTFRDSFISVNNTIKETIKNISDSGYQIALVVDNNSKLLGTITDGDIRRGILSGINLDDSVKKIINYSSEKITDLNEENKKIIKSHPPDIIFIYSARSALSFIEIVKNYSLYHLMTGSKVMCISKKVADIFPKNEWKKIEIFNPGDELSQLEESN